VRSTIIDAMKRWPTALIGTALALALGLALGCRKPKPLFERIYGLDEIPTFELSLSPDARAALTRAPSNPRSITCWAFVSVGSAGLSALDAS
jgi:hypothetical protein